MPWLRHFALFLVFVAALFRPAAAAGFSHVPDAIAQARVGAFELVASTLGQPSSRLFRVPWNTKKLSNFEVDVAGLGARRVAPNIWLIEGEAGLSIGGRVVRSGATLP